MMDKGYISICYPGGGCKKAPVRTEKTGTFSKILDGMVIQPEIRGLWEDRSNELAIRKENTLNSLAVERIDINLMLRNQNCQ